MNLLDRFLGHDAWTTHQLLEICRSLPAALLDREHDIGHRTLRKTLNHIIHNMETWSALMQGAEINCVPADSTIAGMFERRDAAETRLREVAEAAAAQDGWDELWTDTLDNPPTQKSFGTAIAHVITHSMHHRAQVLYMLRLSGAETIPEGDVFSWEAAIQDS